MLLYDCVFFSLIPSVKLLFGELAPPLPILLNSIRGKAYLYFYRLTYIYLYIYIFITDLYPLFSTVT